MSTPLRVALFTDADVFAGTERHMLDLALGLRDVGVAPTIACPAPSPLADRAAGRGIEILPISKRGPIGLKAIRLLIRKLNCGEIDVIHTHNGRTSLQAAVAVSLARRGAFISTQHFLKPARASRSGVKAALSSALHRWMDHKAAGRIAICDAVRQAMIARGDAAEGIVMIPHGIPEPTAVMDRATARAHVNFPADAPIVLCAARLEAEKDILTLVRAMALVAEKMPTVLCLLAGDGSERGRIEASIASKNLAGHVRVLGFREDVSALMSACDVLVLPSPAEPFGLVLLEAMSHGRAVIATRAGGPVEIVGDGETGLLVMPGDFEELSSAIQRISNEPGLSARMGREGLRRYRERFTVAAMARATADMYSKAVENSVSSLSRS